MGELILSIVSGAGLILSGTGKKSPKWFKSLMVVGGVIVLTNALRDKKENELNGLSGCGCDCKNCKNLIKCSTQKGNGNG